MRTLDALRWDCRRHGVGRAGGARPTPGTAAALEREIARVQALAATRASITSRLEAELGNVARRLSALRLQNTILASRWQTIFRANEVLLSRPGRIAPGIVLRIPR